MADHCIVSATTLSHKEASLKNRLYKNPAPVQKPVVCDPEAKGTARLIQTLSTQENNQHMANFLKEMGNQLNEEKSKSSIPQSLLYQQSRVMEKQLQVIETNQKQVDKAMALNDSKKNEMLRHEIYKDSAQLINQTIKPLVEGITESRNMYAETIKKQENIQNKIEELKEVIAKDKVSLEARDAMRQYSLPQQKIIEVRVPSQGTVHQCDPDLSQVKSELGKIEDMMNTLEARSNMLGEAMHGRMTKIMAETQQCHKLAFGIGEEREKPKERLPDFDYFGLLENVSSCLQDLNQIKFKFMEGKLKLPCIIKISEKPNYSYDVPPLKMKEEPKESSQKPAYLNAIITNPLPCIAEIKLPPPQVSILTQIKPQPILKSDNNKRNNTRSAAKTKVLKPKEKQNKDQKSIMAAIKSEAKPHKEVEETKTIAQLVEAPKTIKDVNQPTSLAIKDNMINAIKLEVEKEIEPVKRKLNMMLSSPDAKISIPMSTKSEQNREAMIAEVLADELKPQPVFKDPLEDQICDMLASELMRGNQAKKEIHRNTEQIIIENRAPQMVVSELTSVKEESKATKGDAMKEEQTNTSVIEQNKADVSVIENKKEGNAPIKQVFEEKRVITKDNTKVIEAGGSIAIVNVKKTPYERILEEEVKQNKEDDVIVNQTPIKVETVLSSTKHQGPYMDPFSSGAPDEIYKFGSEISSSRDSMGKNESYSSGKSDGGSRYGHNEPDFNPKLDTRTHKKGTQKQMISVDLLSDQKQV